MDQTFIFLYAILGLPLETFESTGFWNSYRDRDHPTLIVIPAINIIL